MTDTNMKYWRDWEEENHSRNIQYSGAPTLFLIEQVQTILLMDDPLVPL